MRVYQTGRLARQASFLRDRESCRSSPDTKAPGAASVAFQTTQHSVAIQPEQGVPMNRPLCSSRVRRFAWLPLLALIAALSIAAPVMAGPPVIGDIVVDWSNPAAPKMSITGDS